MLNVKYKKMIKSFNFVLIILFVTFQNNNYILDQFWPSLDMITFFPKYFSDTNFGSDFMTSCFEQFTGRFFFGYITGFIYLFFDDWFNFLIFYRLLIFIFLPVSWYLALKSLFKKSKLNLSIVFALIMTSFFAPGLNSFTSIFSFATWSPYFFHFHPGTISAIFVLFGIFFGFKENPNKILAYTFIILGALCHPIFSISITFIFIFSKYFIEKKVGDEVSLLILNILITALQSAFSNFGNLELDSYLEYYAKFHPHHYVPSWENNLFEDIIKISILFLIVYILPIGDNSKSFKILCGSFLSFFVLGLLIQYISIELYPVSKFLILLSPSRFSSYIYWMFVIVIIFKFRKLLMSFEQFTDKIFNSATLIFFLVINFIIFYNLVDEINASGRLEKYYHLNQSEIEVIEWTKNSTLKNDLFLVLGSEKLNKFFTIETERGQYNAIGYPFNDECIEENFKRKNKFYAKPVSEISEYLENNDFNEFKYFVTYIDADTKNLEIAFSNNQFKVIEIYK